MDAFDEGFRVQTPRNESVPVIKVYKCIKNTPTSMKTPKPKPPKFVSVYVPAIKKIDPFVVCKESALMVLNVQFLKT